MKGRNPNVGRHAAGTAIARSGTKPSGLTGGRGPQSPGARTYKSNMPITSATKMMTPSRSANNNNYKAQGEQFIKQHPEPFRNSQSVANPVVPRTKDSSVEQSGAGGGFYKAVKGNRINESIPRSQPNRNSPAVGISGSANSGMGSNRGKVAGQSQPRRAGDPWKGQTASPNSYQGRGGAPSFYGR